MYEWGEGRTEGTMCDVIICETVVGGRSRYVETEFSVEIFKEKKTGTEKENVPMSVRVLKTEPKDVVQG